MMTVAMEQGGYETWRKRFLTQAVPLATMVSGMVYTTQVNRSPVTRAAKTFANYTQSRQQLLSYMDTLTQRSINKSSLARQSLDQSQLLNQLYGQIREGESGQTLLKTLNRLNRIQTDTFITRQVARLSHLTHELTQKPKGFQLLLKEPAVANKLGLSSEEASRLLKTAPPAQWLEKIFQIERNFVRPIPPEWYTTLANNMKRFYERKAFLLALTIYSVLTWIPYTLMHLARHKAIRNN